MTDGGLKSHMSWAWVCGLEPHNSGTPELQSKRGSEEEEEEVEEKKNVPSERCMNGGAPGPQAGGAPACICYALLCCAMLCYVVVRYLWCGSCAQCSRTCPFPSPDPSHSSPLCSVQLHST